MKKVLKVTFGTMLAMSMLGQANAFIGRDPENHLAVWGAVTYTKPSNNALSVGDSIFASGGIFDGGRRTVFLAPDHEWDYALGFTYRLGLSDTRFFMSYDHFDDDESQGNVNLRNIGFQPPPTSSATASLDEHSHEFRLGAIQDLYFGDFFWMDVLAFFEYDNIRRTLLEFNAQAGGINSRETEIKVYGFGPGIGFMTHWLVPYYRAWSIFMGANTSMIWANNAYHQAFQSAGADFYIYDPEDSKSLVAKLDIKFGVNYRCASPCRRFVLDVDLGVRYMNMINALKYGNTTYNPLVQTPVNAGLIVDNFAANTGWPTDWGRWGPFLKFKIGGVHS